MSAAELRALRHRQDAAYTPRISRSEASIRADLRAMVRADLKYTIRGCRGDGMTNPKILDRIRWWRRMHTESVGREFAR